MVINEPLASSLSKYNIRIQPNIELSGMVQFGIGTEIRSKTNGKFCTDTFFVSSIVGSYCVINPGEYKSIVTGNYTTTGEGFKTLGLHPYMRITASVATYTNNHLFSDFLTKQSYYNFRDIIIGNNVWIGSNVLVKNGLFIGNGAVIEDNTIVVKNVPPYAIVSGSPGKIIGMRYTQEQRERMNKLKWFDYDWKGVALDWTNIDACLDGMEQALSTSELPKLNTGFLVNFDNAVDSVKIVRRIVDFDMIVNKLVSVGNFDQLFEKPEIKAHTLDFNG